jgi:hypothetical protein
VKIFTKDVHAPAHNLRRQPVPDFDFEDRRGLFGQCLNFPHWVSRLAIGLRRRGDEKGWHDRRS